MVPRFLLLTHGAATLFALCVRTAALHASQLVLWWSLRAAAAGTPGTETVLCCADVLAGRKTVGTISGQILFAGQHATRTFLRRYTGYVEQFGARACF